MTIGVCFSVQYASRMLGRSRVGKINHNIDIPGERERVRENRIIIFLHGIDVEADNNLHIFFFRTNIGDDLTHAAIASRKCNFQHIFRTP